MSFKEKLIKKVILPLSDLLLKRSISKHLNFLEKSQWWNLNELEEFQNKRLRILIKHAVENVPYYSELFKKLGLTAEDIQTKDDLLKLPILTKADIKQNFPKFIVNKNLKKGTYYKGSTSGSTGEPLNYFQGKDAYSFNIACGLRAWSWMGYKLGDKYIKISQNQRSKKEKKIQDKLMNNDYLFLKNIDNEGIDDAIQLIKNVKPKVIRAYPDPLEFMADELIKRKEFIPLKSIATTGNVLHEAARKKIEFAFQTKIFDGYSGEGSAPFFQCETHECYHGAMEYAISEFIDVSVNDYGIKQGKHIVTNLWNFETPFIRYDSQDLLQFGDLKCSCGRELIAVYKILGRDNDLLVTTNGKSIIAQIFTIFFSKVTSVKQFQMIQIDEVNIICNLIVHEHFSDEDLIKIKDYCDKVFDDNSMILAINLVDKIETTKNGKRRFLINRMK